MLNQAFSWLNQGIATCPTGYRSKFPDCEALKSVGMETNGKATWASLKSSLPTTDQLCKWYGNGRLHNLAVITGWRDLAILDFDNLSAWSAWFAWQVEFSPNNLDTLIVQSSRGLHYYYFLPNLKEKIQPVGFEVKSHGMMCTTYPSIHRSGKAYKIINGSIDKILTVEDTNSLLGFCPVKFEKQIPDSDPWTVVEKSNGDYQRIDLLALFPEARKTDNEGRYYLSHCPLHGKKWNFWLDTELNICGCFAGCGEFLATEIYEIMKSH